MDRSPREIFLKIGLNKKKPPEHISLRGQTIYFVICKQIPFPLFFFCSFIFFDRSDKILICLRTCLWSPGTYRHKIVRLSSAQIGLEVIFLIFFDSRNKKSIHYVHESYKIRKISKKRKLIRDLDSDL